MSVVGTHKIKKTLQSKHNHQHDDDGAGIPNANHYVRHPCSHSSLLLFPAYVILKKFSKVSRLLWSKFKNPKFLLVRHYHLYDDYGAAPNNKNIVSATPTTIYPLFRLTMHIILKYQPYTSTVASWTHNKKLQLHVLNGVWRKEEDNEEEITVPRIQTKCYNKYSSIYSF